MIAYHRTALAQQLVQALQAHLGLVARTAQKARIKGVKIAGTLDIDTSKTGEVAMTALKSARDQLNRPGQVSLMLVMSGSDRDKLLRLVVSASTFLRVSDPGAAAAGHGFHRPCG
jgi:hypothetical protein